MAEQTTFNSYIDLWFVIFSDCFVQFRNFDYWKNLVLFSNQFSIMLLSYFETISSRHAKDECKGKTMVNVDIAYDESEGSTLGIFGIGLVWLLFLARLLVDSSMTKNLKGEIPEI